MQRKAEFQLALAGTVTDFKILSPASYPAYPISPQKWVVFGVAFSLWMVVSFFLVGLFYLMNNKINTLAELEKLVNIPLLGGIPHYSVEKMKESRLVIGKDSNTVISEAFRTIRTNLQFIISKKDSLVISLTSSISGEGKTFVAINLATVLAFSRKKVVLVDLDLRKPRIYKIFNNRGDRGISTILIGIHRLEECIFPSSIENLDYIVGGPIPPNPSELLMSPEFEEFIRALKEKYDIILLDTPPVGLVTDGVLVMKKSDVQLFIMRASYSRKQFLKSLEKLNRIHHFSRLALILNGVKKTPGYNYGYGYGNTSYFDKKRV
jgi:capsular exopolysaccharide synthesis family protein